MKPTLLLQSILSLLLAWNASAAQSYEEEENKGTFVIDLAYGWTATRGNDVQVGDRTSVSSRGYFDLDTTYEPLITEMENEFMPFARLCYEGRKWGLQGEYWRLGTSGSLEASFANTGAERDELVQIWETWHGEDEDRTRYAARNDLSLYSIRIDLTRALTRNVLLTLGAQIAKLENERVEEVRVENDVTLHDPRSRPIATRTVAMTTEGRSRIGGWLVGPSVGLRGTGRLGSSVEIGYAFTQSLLFAEPDHEASWSRQTSIPSEPVFALDTALSSRAAVPVTDLRGALTVNLGSYFSFGAFAFLSVWFDVPMARELSVPLERWQEPRRTLAIASFGPVLKFKF